MKFIFFELFVVVDETSLASISIRLLLRRLSVALEYQPYSAALEPEKRMIAMQKCKYVGFRQRTTSLCCQRINNDTILCRKLIRF